MSVVNKVCECECESKGTEFFQAFFSQLHRLLSEVAAIIFFVFILTSTVRLLDCFNDRRFSLCRLDFHCFKSLRVLV